MLQEVDQGNREAECDRTDEETTARCICVEAVEIGRSCREPPTPTLTLLKVRHKSELLPNTSVINLQCLHKVAGGAVGDLLHVQQE